jgi:hypothetical protein
LPFPTFSGCCFLSKDPANILHLQLQAVAAQNSLAGQNTDAAAASLAGAPQRTKKAGPEGPA